MRKPQALHSAFVLMFLLGLFLASSLLGAESSGGAPTGTKLSAKEVTNLRYLRQNVAIGLPYKLNLADPRQYAFVIDTLRRAGVSAERSPHLFKLLEKARTTGKTGKPRLVKAGLTLEGVNYITEFGQLEDGDFYTSAFSTYPSDQVPDYTRIILTLIDLEENTNIGSKEGSLCAQTNLEVAVAGRPVSESDIEANALFLIKQKKHDLVEPYVILLTDLKPVRAACQLSPNYKPAGGGGTQQCNTNAATACVDPTRGNIKICYGPRVNSDCDYGCTGSGNPPNIIFPIAGNFTPAKAPTSPLTGSLDITLTDAAGGGCMLTATTDLSAIKVDKGIVTWNLNPASFPNKDCLRPNGMLFDYTFQLFLQTAGGHIGATFTSRKPKVATSNTVIVPKIDVLQGCLPAGVKVRMADGSERAIETFQAYGDEKVRSQGKADVRAVTGKTWGSEEHPLVRIRDDRGHTLLLTEAHPVVTSRGPVMASQLKQGDVVLTESGEAALVEVGRQPSPKAVPVHNLRVGTEEEAAAGEATFYANGILVGDQLMQRELMLQAVKPRRLSKEEILQRLPAVWRQDCQSSESGLSR